MAPLLPFLESHWLQAASADVCRIFAERISQAIAADSSHCRRLASRERRALDVDDRTQGRCRPIANFCYGALGAAKMAASEVCRPRD